MTVEQLHDAIGLLPADLVAQADGIRSGKPPRRHWQRYAAMAACCVLVIGCAVAAGSWRAGGAKASAADEAAPMQAMPPASAQGGRRQSLLQGRCIGPAEPSPAAGDMAPKACLVHSEAQLEQCRREWADYYGPAALEQAFQGYDDQWFARQTLVLLPVDGGETLEVSQILHQDSQWQVLLQGQPGTRHWLVLVEAEPGAVEQISQIQAVFPQSQE